jgi:hypothetical protein
MQHRPEISKTALFAHQAGEMHHFVLRRRIRAVAGFFEGVHFGRDGWCRVEESAFGKRADEGRLGGGG